MKRKFLDEKGRIFGIISLIDIIVILVVAALVVCFYLKFNVVDVNNSKSAESKEITYSLEVHGISEGSIKAYQIGDKLYNTESGSSKYLGEIADVIAEPATEAMQKLDGTIVEGEIEEKYDLHLKVKCDAIIHNGSYLLGDVFNLYENDSYNITSKYVTFSATVTDITDNG